VPAAKIVGDRRYSIACDYLGTPVQAYDEKGEKVWDCELDIYGNVRTIEGSKTFIPFRYQGQYEDEETGLYYNRFRYYSADSGTYLSQDPLRLDSGEPNFYASVVDTNSYLDPFGLSSTVLNNHLGGVVGDKMQAHHVIPEEIWGQNKQFLDDIGLGGQRDLATNGILLPDNAGGVTKNGPQVVHRGSHPKYSAEIDGRLQTIKKAHADGLIDDKAARNAVRKLQMEYKNKLWDGDVPNKIVGGKKKLH